MKNLKVSGISQNKIKHVYIKKQTRKNFLFSGVALVVLMLSCCMIKYVNIFNGYANLCSQIYAPINSLFNDSGGIIFTGKFSSNTNKKTLKLLTPIKSSKVESINGELHYTIDASIMVLSPEDGIVKAVGVLPSGEKYIEIAHSGNIFSRIENIGILGVILGEVVAKGKDIATATVGEVVRFSVYVDGIKQTNITLDKNQILWENSQ